MTLKLKYGFDEQTYRHTLNGHEVVLHCHHYMALTTKLAMELEGVDGTQILAEVAEDTIRPMLETYVAENGVSDPAAVLQVGAEYYAVMGLGKMVVESAPPGGKIRVPRSHVDEGWVKKWGQHDQPVNHFTRGYVAAMFAVAARKPPRSYRVQEVSSVVQGASETILTAEPVT